MYTTSAFTAAYLRTIRMRRARRHSHVLTAKTLLLPVLFFSAVLRCGGALIGIGVLAHLEADGDAAKMHILTVNMVIRVLIRSCIHGLLAHVISVVLGGCTVRLRLWTKWVRDSN